MRKRTVLSRYHWFCWVKIPTQNSSTAAAPTRLGCELSTTWLWKIKHSLLYILFSLKMWGLKQLNSFYPLLILIVIFHLFSWILTIVCDAWRPEAKCLWLKLIVTNLNDTVQQPDIVSIGGSSEEWCHPVSDLLRHALRTHAVVLQEQLDAAYEPGTNRGENSWR